MLGVYAWRVETCPVAERNVRSLQEGVVPRGAAHNAVHTHSAWVYQAPFSTPNPQVCRFYFLNLVQKEKFLLRKPDPPF